MDHCRLRPAEFRYRQQSNFLFRTYPVVRRRIPSDNHCQVCSLCRFGRVGVRRSQRIATMSAASLAMAVAWVNSPTDYLPRPSFPKPVLEGLIKLQAEVKSRNSVVATCGLWICIDVPEWLTDASRRRFANDTDNTFCSTCLSRAEPEANGRQVKIPQHERA